LLVGGLTIVTILSAGGVFWFLLAPLPLPHGVSQTEFREAEELILQRYRRQATRLDTVSLLGEMAFQDQRYDVALACFSQIPATDPQYGLSAQLLTGQVLLQQNQAVAAEQQLRDVLRLSYEPVGEKTPAVERYRRTARELLVFILSVELRLEERRRFLEDLASDGQADLKALKQLHFPNLLIWNSATGRKRLEAFLLIDPENPLLNLAYSRYLIGAGELDSARVLLAKLHQTDPSNLAIAAGLLECYFEQADWGAIEPVMGKLPPASGDDPWQLLRMRAEWAQYRKDWPHAITHWQQLATTDPANPWSPMGLASAYGALKQPLKREAALRTSLVLSEIRVQLVNVQITNPPAINKLVQDCRKIGLQAAADIFQQALRAARLSSPGRLKRLPQRGEHARD